MNTNDPELARAVVMQFVDITFALSNKKLFNALYEIAQQVDLYQPPAMSEMVAEARDRWNGIVTRARE